MLMEWLIKIEDVRSYVSPLAQTLSSDFTLLNDNAALAGIRTWEYLAMENIRVAQSPDLNIIDHAWDMLLIRGQHVLQRT